MHRHFFTKLYINYSKKKSVKLFRPFIKISRFKLLKFCEFWNLPIHTDYTNFRLNNKRNRLRLQLLPYIKYFFNKKFFKKIIQIQKIILIENKYFNFIIKKLIFIKSICFINIPKIFQYRIIHNYLILFKKKISFHEVELIINKIINKKK